MELHSRHAKTLSWRFAPRESASVLLFSPPLPWRLAILALTLSAWPELPAQTSCLTCPLPTGGSAANFLVDGDFASAAINNSSWCVPGVVNGQTSTIRGPDGEEGVFFLNGDPTDLPVETCQLVDGGRSKVPVHQKVGR